MQRSQQSVEAAGFSDGRDSEYDVVIIGAGFSGLLACKYCLAEGLRTLVLESRGRVGGVWAYTDDPRFGGVMKRTCTTSSRTTTEISDFPMPEHYPLFPSHSQMYSYLEAYCEKFSLLDHIRFGQRVTSVSKRGQLWQIKTADGTRAVAPHLIVASGVHQSPNDVSGDQRFAGYTGKLVHSAAVKEIGREWAGKTIVVWGGGESASDIAQEASYVAGQTYLCIPNGQWFVPKRVDRLPPTGNTPTVLDHITSRIRLMLSPTHRYSPFIWQYLDYAFGFNGHGLEAWKTAAPYNRSFFNKSADVLKRVKSGDVLPRRDIRSCQGKTVHFTDGTHAEVDLIVTCCGYRTEFPYFDASVAPATDPRKWFKYIFDPNDPSLAFIGFVRPIFGSIPAVSELQSRYVAQVFAGARRLPPAAERAAITERDAAFWNHHFRHTSQRIGGLVDMFLYTDQLAKLIGCYPNFWKLFWSKPRLWWQAVSSPWNGCQFWLNDPRHHERILATLKRYHDNRPVGVHLFLALAPVLPFLSLATHWRVFRMERALRRAADPSPARAPQAASAL